MSALRAGGASGRAGCTAPGAFTAPTSAAATRLPRSASRSFWHSCECLLGLLQENATRTVLLRARGGGAQDGVILAKDEVLLSVGLVALVARGRNVPGHLPLERILVAEAEVG